MVVYDDVTADSRLLTSSSHFAHDNEDSQTAATCKTEDTRVSCEYALFTFPLELEAANE